MEIKSESPGLLQKILGESTSKWRPLQASLELTNKCNERCTHCYLDSYKDDPSRILNLEQWLHILRELRSAGVLYLILMGGEAMLNPLFWDIARQGSEMGFSVSMITNGLKINSPEVAQKLAEVGFSHLTFSLYSLDSSIHDRMTSVKGSHQKTMQAIQWCKEAGIPLGINCLLTKNNIEGYFDVAEWCIANGFEIKADLSITPKFNSDLQPTHLRASREQIAWYYETLTKKWPGGLPRPNEDKPVDYICNAGKGKCAVTPYGDLLSCIEIRESMGNLLEKPFQELWHGPVAMKWRTLKVQDIKNTPEGLANFCEHCPGMAKHETGDHLQVSKFFQQLAAIKKETYQKLGDSHGQKIEKLER